MGVEEDLAERIEQRDIRGAVIALIASAFGFVAALFWRDAIQAFIETVLPQGDTLIWKFVAAVAVTIIAIIAIALIVWWAARLDRFRAPEPAPAARPEPSKPAK